ncbi:MAG TPA: hypothetical protein VH934_23205 [Xanthobacteraceae bacterium]|jgi:hypothetical protein
MSTPDDIPVGSDLQEDFTICPSCGEDLPHHLCDGLTAGHE